MRPEFKKHIQDLGIQLNATLQEEQLEAVCLAVVRECARVIKANETLVRNNTQTRGLADILQSTRANLLKYFDIEDDNEQPRESTRSTNHRSEGN